MKVIINADDFGLNHSVNLAIVEAFQKGFITNTTIMVNMPGFEEAVQLSKEYGFFDKVGFHFNLFEGEPLTNEIKDEPLFYHDTLTSFYFFHKGLFFHRFFVRKRTSKAIRSEFIAQWEKYQRAGFPQRHMDSHGHSHIYLSVFSSINNEMRTKGVNTVRKSLNMISQHRSWIVRYYKGLINHLIAKQFNTVKYFTSAKEFMGSAPNYADNSVCEIMVHPVYENETLSNMGGPSFELLESSLMNFQKISYSDCVFEK